MKHHSVSASIHLYQGTLKRNLSQIILFIKYSTIDCKNSRQNYIVSKGLKEKKPLFLWKYCIYLSVVKPKPI